MFVGLELVRLDFNLLGLGNWQLSIHVSVEDPWKGQLDGSDIE